MVNKLPYDPEDVDDRAALCQHRRCYKSEGKEDWCKKVPEEKKR